MQLLISVGIQKGRGSRDGTQHTDAGGMLLVDFESKQVLRHVECTPTMRCEGDNVRMAFGSFKEDWYYTCLPTEVLRFHMPDLKMERVLTHPTFDDLHHVLALDDRLWVCNTGLDIMQTFDYQGNLLETFNAASVPTWERFSPEIDYRLQATTKPHERHINYIFVYEGKIWLTRFHQKDAVCISDPSDIMPVEVGNPHDGIVVGDEVWFTTTNGHIVIVDAPRRRIARDIDLNAIKHTLGSVQLGWCRGIDIDAENGCAYVGFTRFRETKFREFASWIKHAGGPRYPARIEKIDLETEEVVDTMGLEPLATVVFGITIVPPHLRVKGS